MASPSIVVESLTKAYGNHIAVNDITFSVSASSIFGLLGPNGAGKTTTIKMMTGLIRPDRGRIKILGKDLSRSPVEIKRQIGHVYANMAFYPWLNAEENLVFFGQFYGMGRKKLKERIEETLGFVNLRNERKKRIGQYSQGMKQRLGIAKALLHSPDILFFDEATSGVDVEGINDIRQLMYELRVEGKTLIIASHRLDEIELVCDRIAILDKGHLLAEGSPDDIRRSLRGLLFKYLVRVDEPLAGLEDEETKSWFLGDANVVLADRDLTEPLTTRFGREAVNKVEPTLEEAFLWMLQHPSRKGGS
jgi:ABC-2 type transport system ATP-binding protein